MTLTQRMFAMALLAAVVVAVSSSSSLIVPKTAEPSPPDLSNATEVKLWATVYYQHKATASDASDAVPLRNMSDEVIGPKLSPKDWCTAALEGTVRVGGVTYNYAGVRSPSQTRCSSHRASERVRWVVSPFEFGMGSRNNAIEPFKTLACDLGTVSGSKPWLNGGYAKFGQEIFIPDAMGAKLPDGSIHNGIFNCGATGGAIRGNHIDVFIGPASSVSEAEQLDPFSFVSSTPSKTFQAYVLK